MLHTHLTCVAFKINTIVSNILCESLGDWLETGHEKTK
jgi:hypothetical protein